MTVNKTMLFLLVVAFSHFLYVSQCYFPVWFILQTVSGAVAVQPVFRYKHAIFSGFHSIYAITQHRQECNCVRVDTLGIYCKNRPQICVCFSARLPLGQLSDGRSNGMTASHLSRYHALHAFIPHLCGSDRISAHAYVFVCVCGSVCTFFCMCAFCSQKDSNAVSQT